MLVCCRNLSLTSAQALLTFIQAHQGLANERAEALVRILKLADEKDEAKERITNIDDLEIYEHAAKQLAKGGDGDAHELSDAIGNIRWLAVQKIPTDENFATACLKKCMTESNFDAALRVSYHSSHFSTGHVRILAFANNQADRYEHG